MKDNQLKPVHYLVKHEENKYIQKNDCHPILQDQFSIRINNKGDDTHIKHLDSFSFQSIVPFESKYKRPKKIKRNHVYNNQLSSMTLIFLVKKMNQINHKIRRIKTLTH